MTSQKVSAHFGEWLQGRLGPRGPVALVTLLCPAHHALSPGPTPLPFSDETLAEFLGQLGCPNQAPFSVDLTMPWGAGCGASTAALTALARARGFAAEPQDLARACLRVEQATDPLMYPEPDELLWGSRRARVISKLPPPPACEIVGGFWQRPTETIATDTQFPDISDLIPDWQMACEQGDLLQAAKIATISSTRTTALRGPQDPMARLSDLLGALGHIRAHTGSARGLIFPPGHVPADALKRISEAGLREVIQFQTGGRSGKAAQ